VTTSSGNCVKKATDFLLGFAKGLFDDQYLLEVLEIGEGFLCLSSSHGWRRTSDRGYRFACRGVPAFRAVLIRRFMGATWRRDEPGD
jgi:hypothetical protein